MNTFPALFKQLRRFRQSEIDYSPRLLKVESILVTLSGILGAILSISQPKKVEDILVYIKDE